MSSYKPNVYVLGGKPEIILTPLDLEGVFFVPTQSRLSIKEPDGTVITVSGGDFTIVGSGYLSYIFHPTQVGWYEYEGWVKDGNGREDTDTHGFDVTQAIF